MPRSQTQSLKRVAGYALRSLEKAQERILELKLIFEPVEPTYAQLAELILLTIEQAIDSLESFCIHAWGGVPEKLERWTQTGHDWHLVRRKANNFDGVWCEVHGDWVAREALVQSKRPDSAITTYDCPQCHRMLLLESLQEKELSDDDETDRYA